MYILHVTELLLMMIMMMMMMMSISIASTIAAEPESSSRLLNLLVWFRGKISVVFYFLNFPSVMLLFINTSTTDAG